MQKAQALYQFQPMALYTRGSTLDAYRYGFSSFAGTGFSGPSSATSINSCIVVAMSASIFEHRSSHLFPKVFQTFLWDLRRRPTMCFFHSSSFYILDFKATATRSKSPRPYEAARLSCIFCNLTQCWSIGMRSPTEKPKSIVAGIFAEGPEEACKLSKSANRR